jgi:carbon monoxide dehydrogenase subunit G
MEFENSFDVAAPIDDVYATLLDVERVAPCVPGAQVLEKTGDSSYKVGIKVRVGPMSMQYRGDIEIIESDPAAHSAVMRARARESRGQGNADATVRMNLSEQDGRTHGTMATDVQLSGRVAAMGRGVIQDVSGKIVDQFATNLAAMLEGTPEPEPVAEPAPAAAEAPRAAPPPPPAEDSLSAIELAGAVAKGRLSDPKTIGVIAAAVLVLLLLAGRRR